MGKRNTSLDSLKTCACFLVVFIHSVNDAFTPYAEYARAFARAAVPIFLMISGFYFLKIVEKGKEKSYLKKIISLTLQATLFYIILALISGESILMSFRQFLNWIVQNKVPLPYCVHLWYLYALIYVFVIVCTVKKYLSSRNITIAVSTLLSIGYILSFTTEYYRNFLFLGLPYFLTGILIFKHQEKISHLKIFNKSYIPVFLLILTLLLESEYILYKHYEIAPTRDHYLMIFPLCIYIFCCTICYQHVSKENLISKVGEKYSSSIYVYHMFTLYLMSLLNVDSHLPMLRCSYAYPIVVMLLTILLVYFSRKIKQMLSSIGFLT